MALIDKIKEAGRNAIYPVILGASLAFCPATNLYSQDNWTDTPYLAQAPQGRKTEMQDHFSKATAYFNAGNYQKAIDEWTAVLKIDPNHELSKIKIEKARQRMRETQVPAETPRTPVPAHKPVAPANKPVYTKPAVQPVVQKPAEQKSHKNEFYIKAGMRSLNPKKYNAEIKRVSYGEGFEDVMSFGLGYTRKLTKHFSLGLEADYNNQSVKAIREVVATGKREAYGKNDLRIISANLPVYFTANLFGKTDIDVSVSPELAMAKLSSSNSKQKTSTSHYLYGARAGLELKQGLGPVSVGIGAFYHAIPEYDNVLDISGLETAVKLGVKFK